MELASDARANLGGPASVAALEGVLHDSAHRLRRGRREGVDGDGGVSARGERGGDGRGARTSSSRVEPRGESPDASTLMGATGARGSLTTTIARAAVVVEVGGQTKSRALVIISPHRRRDPVCGGGNTRRASRWVRSEVESGARTIPTTRRRASAATVPGDSGCRLACGRTTASTCTAWR